MLTRQQKPLLRPLLQRQAFREASNPHPHPHPTLTLTLTLPLP